jgi:hypothetical protein
VWQNKSIEAAILKLKGELSDRIAQVETADLKLKLELSERAALTEGEIKVLKNAIDQRLTNESVLQYVTRFREGGKAKRVSED